MNRTEILALIFNLLLVVLELRAVVLCHRRYPQSWILPLKFYTVQSNLFTLFSSSAFSICAIAGLLGSGSKMPAWVTVSRFLSTVDMALTFFIVLLVLMPEEYRQGKGMKIFYDRDQLYHHLICPWLTMISFVCFEPSLPATFFWFWIGAVPTMIYGVIALIINVSGIASGPYSFLLVRQQPVWKSILWIVLVFAIVLVLSTVLLILA